MSEALIAEFAAHLGEVARRHAGRPRAELDELWRLGLEREAIVTVAYRHDRIGLRLARMPIDHDARDVIARAVRWAWRDEQAHTLWIRGAHMKWSDAAAATLAETRGRIGGWMSSEQHNVRWRDSPVTRAIAEAIKLVGNATGSVPAAVRRSLTFQAFRDICAFNHGAETTAAMAWRRMADLAAGIDDDSRRGFVRMAEDEDRHARVFAILRDAFDTGDRLVVTAAQLRARLHEVGQRFVARPDETAPAWKNQLGKGGTVVVREGRELVDVVGAALDASGIILEPGATVALKTTFMLVTHPADPSPGVTPGVLAAVIAWLENRGAQVRVIDAENLYDHFHDHRSVHAVAERIGVAGEIVDAQDDQVPHAYTRGLGVETISKTWRDADVRILLGKLRSHPTSTALLSLEAAEGLGARHDDLLFLERRAERETAILMAVDAAPPHLAILDAFADVPDGLMGVLGHDKPLQPHRLYVARDAVALDAVVCRHIGAAPDRGGMLVDAAFDWFGDPQATTVVDGPNTPIEGFRLPDHSSRTALLAMLALPMFTFASGRGALFLPRFDEEAFPPIRPSKLLSAARSIVHAIVADPPAEPRATPVLPTSMLSTRAGTIRIARIGKGGTPLVCLHGYPETLQIWSALAPRLAREVVAFDWPGLGYSSPVTGAAHPYELADHLLAVLDAARLDRVDLIAADMGAPAALVFAHRHPERVHSVTCTSALLFGDADTSLEIKIMRRANLARRAFSIAPKLVYARSKQSMLEGDLPRAIDDDFANAFARPSVRERLGWMCIDYEKTLPGLPEVYWKLRCPVQLLWAEDDHHFAVEHAERFCAIVPTARMRVIPNARHWMMLERAAELAVHLR